MNALRSAYAGLLLVIVAYLALAMLYFAILPPLEGNDSLAHMNYVNYLREEARLPQVDSATAEYSYELVQQPPLYYGLAALVARPLAYDDADVQTRRSENAYFGVLSPRWSISLPDATASFYQAVRISRLIAVLGGLLAVVATWLWVMVALPGQPYIATATAALVAFNPLFLFLATTVTNDTWAIAGMIVPIWLVTAAARRLETRTWQWLGIGLVIGLAVLTKYSVLLVGLPILAILLAQPHLRSRREFARAVALLMAGALLTGGFWYLRNLWLYGELVPARTLTAAIPTLMLETPVAVNAIMRELPWLLQSYWGIFVAVPAPPDFYLFWRIFMLGGTVGILLYIARTRRAARWDLLLICTVWIGVVLFSGLNWMRFVAFGIQARLIQIAAPAIALTLVTGWRAFFPRRWQNSITALMIPLLALVALWPLPTLAERFALPTPLAAETLPDRPVYATFAGGPTLRGFDLPAGAALEPDASLPLTLYFETDQIIDEDYTLFIHLSDREDNLLYQWDGVPFAGRHPTRQWRTFELFADRHTLTLEDVASTTEPLTLSIGFYRRDAPDDRLTVYAADGAPIGDRLALADIRVLDEHESEKAPTAQKLAAWEGGIELLAADLERSDDLLTLTTTWQTDRILAADYTIFVQFLNEAGEIVAQVDEEPQGGNAPTTTWLPDTPISDTIQLAQPAEAWQSLIIGLYERPTGTRLPLAGDNAGRDFFIVTDR